MNRKGNLGMRWPENLALALLIIGFAFQLTTIGSSFLSYTIIFFWGMLFGRLWHSMRTTFRFPLVIIMVAFLAGYIGATFFTGYGKALPLSVFFLAGIMISHYLHSRDLLPLAGA